MPTPPLRLMQDDVRPPQAETPSQHCGNALQLIRWVLDRSPIFHTPEGQCVAVQIFTLFAIQARLEAAIERLEVSP